MLVYFQITQHLQYIALVYFEGKNRHSPSDAEEKYSGEDLAICHLWGEGCQESHGGKGEKVSTTPEI